MARGVVRLLQAGHFKGVADARLRINFHEALARAEAAGTTVGPEESEPTEASPSETKAPGDTPPAFKADPGPCAA